MTAAPAPTALERRMRRRRVAKIVLAVVFAVVWIPIAILLLVVNASGQRS